MRENKEPAKKKRNLNLFGALDAIQLKNKKYYRSLTPAQKKEFVPFIIMRWLSGSNNRNKIERLNGIVNILAEGPGAARDYIRGEHGALFYNLLICSMDGRREVNRWLKKNGGTINRSKSLSVVMRFFSYGSREANDALKILSAEDIMDMAAQLGLQKDEIAELKKELKAGAAAGIL